MIIASNEYLEMRKKYCYNINFKTVISKVKCKTHGQATFCCLIHNFIVFLPNKKDSPKILIIANALLDLLSGK